MVATPLSFPADHVILGTEWQQFLDFGLPVYKRKPVDETVTASTTLQDDNDLYIHVDADAWYHVFAFLIYTASTAGDFKLGWTAPAGSSFDWHMGGPPSTAATAAVTGYWQSNSLSGVEAMGGIGGGSPLVASPNGLLRTGDVAGLFRPQFAQFVSDATATTLKVGSCVVAYRIA